MNYNWQKYNWWSICIIVALAVFLILYYASPNTDKDNARYILSAISQGLAAILALVFTITLVVAQMTRRYTAMDMIIFRPGTIGLMIIFGLGVVIPLLALKTGFWGLGVNLSIALAVLCVFSLIPFLKDVNSILKYEIGVGNLYEEIMESISLGNTVVAKSRIRELMEIDKGAVKESRESVVVNIIYCLSRIVEKSVEVGQGDTASFVLWNLKDIGVNSAGRGFEGAVYYVTAELTDIGGKVAKLSFMSGIVPPATEAIDGLKDIGIKAAEKGLKKYEIYTYVAEGLSDICMKLEDKSLAVGDLWWLGAFVMKYLPEKCDKVIQNLKEIEQEIGTDALMRGVENCIRGYPQIKDSFEDFKKQYNET